MAYIQDIIGDDYRSWENGDTIMLSAPTGSGKTTFIFETLLPYFAKKGQRILLLVNRKVLSEQLEQAISQLPIELAAYIEIRTYQSLELQLKKTITYLVKPKEYQIGYNDARTQFVKDIQGQYFLPKDIKRFQRLPAPRDREAFSCIVCDEAHYFLSESNYNTNTIFSFNFIRDMAGSNMQIFMSVTPNDISTYINEHYRAIRDAKSYWSHFILDEGVSKSLLIKDFIKEYAVDRNYEHVNLQIINDREEIASLIYRKGGKWLVFVDSKEFGKKLKNDLITLDRDIPCEFVTADYREEIAAQEEVDSIVKREKQKTRVLIATSVLDNGVNLKDEKLRNIIIIADHETEFIQMLGRKRADGQILNVYFLNHTKKYFNRRLNETRYLLERVKPMMIKMYRELKKVYSCTNDEVSVHQREEELLYEQHCYFIDNLHDNLDLIENMCVTYNGMIFLNPLSYKNLENLNHFYKKMITAFDDLGSNAYICEVLRWLKKDSEDELLRLTSSLYENSCQKIITQFEKEVERDEWIPLTEFQKIKKQLKPALINIIEEKYPNKEKIDSEIRAATRADRGFKEEFLEWLNGSWILSILLKRMGVKNTKYLNLRKKNK